jgi:primosomal protein N'
MKKTKKYGCNAKPRKCPACGSSHMADILYGLPVFSEELQAALDTGRIVLGGCVVTDHDPSWQCTDCATRIYRVETT